MYSWIMPTTRHHPYHTGYKGTIVLYDVRVQIFPKLFFASRASIYFVLLLGPLLLIKADNLCFARGLQ